MKKTIAILNILFLLCFLPQAIFSQTDKLDSLTIEKIMRDPAWVGRVPARTFWSEDGRYVYFYWSPKHSAFDTLYRVPRSGGTPQRVTPEEEQKLPSRYGDYTRDRKLKVYEKNGDIFLLKIKSGKVTQLTKTVARESSPEFSFDEKYIIFRRDGNLFTHELKTGIVRQITDFRKGQERKKNGEGKTDQEKWLRQQQLSLFEIIKKQKEQREQREKLRMQLKPRMPKPIYLGKKSVRNMQLSPDMRFVTFSLYQRASGAKRTVVPNYVTETGFTEDIPSRTKVGAPQGKMEMKIYDIEKDTVYSIKVDNLPGISDEPEYLKEYQKKKKDTSKKAKEKKRFRAVRFSSPIWSDDGKRAILLMTAQDNKDYWIAELKIQTGKLKPLYRHHDEAWIGGPGLNFWRSTSSLGWMPDNRRIWFQSEESGYNHLYILDTATGKKKQLTSGKYEIYSPKMSRNKKYWYFTSNEVHPGERHFYRMDLDGKNKIRLTKMTGYNRVTLSPDEKFLAIVHSFSNMPWELYLMKNSPDAKPVQITHSTTEEFRSYPWRAPEVITFPARDGAQVHARLYRPKSPQPGGPAVIFVHGAGYMQNAHKWWSSYFREYMFNNLLADHGYTVLDIDYRGSAGYGRDWRTAIYRHMGGKDLADQVDGAKFLVKKYGVDSKRIGIYGGSYGGFITLMAMFKEPDVFAAGAALRPVTDWAHYNHSYASNILNVPYADSVAYVRSSPIYFADGLKGPLLICHGMVDRNVHFQDVVRLTQRLIELGKKNWQLAVYPVEDHGFRQPSSWQDEYRRIFELFEENLK